METPLLSRGAKRNPAPPHARYAAFVDYSSVGGGCSAELTGSMRWPGSPAR